MFVLQCECFEDSRHSSEDSTARYKFVNLERENQLLKRRLAAITKEAANNDSILKRSLEREMRLLEASSLDDLLQLMVHGLAESYALESVTLMLCDPDHTVRHLLTGERPVHHTLPGVIFVESLDSPIPQLDSRTQPWLGPYSREDHHLVFEGAADLRSVALIPLERNHRFFGSLNFGSSDPERFTKEHATDFLHRLGAIASFCLENALNRARLIRTGLTDVLTGWYNRRYLEDRIFGELARSQRNQQPIVCLLMDIDHFKRVNDSHGHLAGDAVLREIAHRVADKLRTSDVAARFGGDELAVLLPNTESSEARHLAERIRKTVSEAPIEARPGHELHFTLCIGIAGMIPELGVSKLELMRERLLERADAALYRAKSSGRNRVELYPGSERELN